MLRFKAMAVIGLVCMVALVLSIGCTGTTGPKTEPVSGVVTLDGNPLDGANVVFSPSGGGGKAAAGTTDSSGNYKLTTQNPSDGAVVGSYQVSITKVEGSAPAVDLSGLSEQEKMKKSMEAYYSSDRFKKQGGKAGGPEVKSLVPAKYGDPKTSGLTAEVKAGPNSFNFDLKSEGGESPASSEAPKG